MPPKAADGRRPSPDGRPWLCIVPCGSGRVVPGGRLLVGANPDTVLSDAARRWPDRPRWPTPVIVPPRRPSYAELDQRPTGPPRRCTAWASRQATGTARRQTAASSRRLVRAMRAVSDPSDACPVTAPPNWATAVSGHRAGGRRCGPAVHHRPMARELVADHHPAFARRRWRSGTVRTVGAAVRPVPVRRAPPADPGRQPLLVSGGTTGMPKLIPCTHDDYVFNATAAPHSVGLAPTTSIWWKGLPATLPLAARRGDRRSHCRVLAPDPSPRPLAAIERHGVVVTARCSGTGQTRPNPVSGEPVTPKLAVVAGWRVQVRTRGRSPLRTALTPGPAGVSAYGGAAEATRIGDPPEVVEHHPGGHYVWSTNCASSTPMVAGGAREEGELCAGPAR